MAVKGCAMIGGIFGKISKILSQCNEPIDYVYITSMIHFTQELCLLKLAKRRKQ
jgi:hypothetical protein